MTTCSGVSPGAGARDNEGHLFDSHVEPLESTHLMGGRKGRARLFPVVPSGQTRSTESKNTQEIPLKICCFFFLIKSTQRAVTMMALKH